MSDTILAVENVSKRFAGRIARSGGKELALELEAKGYGWIDKEAAAAVR